VYRGTLSGGREIAIKRLDRHGLQVHMCTTQHCLLTCSEAYLAPLNYAFDAARSLASAGLMVNQTGAAKLSFGGNAYRERLFPLTCLDIWLLH